MESFTVIVVGGLVILTVEYAVRCAYKAWSARRRFSLHESAILQSLAFLVCERHGVGAEATLKIGGEVFEDWAHLAAFETLLADGYVQRFPGHSQYGLSARGQLVATRLFDRGARTPYVSETYRAVSG